jgi:hypothetical protein
MFTLGKHWKRANHPPEAANPLTEVMLNGIPQGLFLLDAKDRILPPVSPSLGVLFRRQDFANLTFEKLIAPVVTPKTLTAARNHIAALMSGAAPGAAPGSVHGAGQGSAQGAAQAPQGVAQGSAQRAAQGAAQGSKQGAAHGATPAFRDIDVRLKNDDGSFDNAHYSFEFESIAAADEPRLWLVRVTDITARVQATRELDELRAQVQTQGDILRSVLQLGAARFGAFIQKTEGSMNAIGTVLKKPAREEAAFRDKLEEILNEADRIRRDAAAFRLSSLEAAARAFEDALQDLRLRGTLSGSDFLPLAVKLDQLYGQFALVKSLTAAAAPVTEADPTVRGAPTTDGGTAIMEAPNFSLATPAGIPAESDAPPAKDRGGGGGAQPTAPAGSLGSTLQSLTEHVAQEHDKQVLLETSGLHLVPPKYLALIKNVAIQLIRNAVMHGIELPEARRAAGKSARGTLRLEFRMKDGNYELLFEDDGCGLVPEQVRATAIARGVLSEEAAARLRDREAIKLIFKSRFTTLADSPEDTRHGAGMSLVRRYVHEAGGKIALASLAGHETRFKIVLPATADSQAA